MANARISISSLLWKDITNKKKQMNLALYNITNLDIVIYDDVDVLMAICVSCCAATLSEYTKHVREYKSCTNQNISLNLVKSNE